MLAKPMAIEVKSLIQAKFAKFEALCESYCSHFANIPNSAAPYYGSLMAQGASLPKKTLFGWCWSFLGGNQWSNMVAPCKFVWASCFGAGRDSAVSGLPCNRRQTGKVSVCYGWSAVGTSGPGSTKLGRRLYITIAPINSFVAGSTALQVCSTSESWGYMNDPELGDSVFGYQSRAGLMFESSL